MKKIYENINWREPSVVQLSDKNVPEARKIVKKEKEGIIELLNQGVSSKRLKGLSETDKELIAALYLLVYKEKNVANNKTNSEFLEELFDVKDISELIKDIDLFKENAKKIIVDPIRKKSLEPFKEEEPKKDKPKKDPKEDKTKKDKTKKDKTKKDKPKKDDDDYEDDDEDEDEENKDSLAPERKFEEAMRELENTKNEAIKKLDKLLPKAKNQRAIQNQKDEIIKNFTKRLNNMKKAQSGTVLNPRLRVQQELAAGKSFIDRSVNTAQSAQMPGIAGRAVSALRDARKAVGREVGAAKDALGRTLPARIAKQVTNDAKARFVYQQLGAKDTEKFVYSDSKEEKDKIYQAAEKARVEKESRAGGEKEPTPEEKAKAEKERIEKEKEEKAREERRRKKREELRPRSRSAIEQEQGRDKDQDQQISSTSYEGLNTINEDIKIKIKNNMISKK